MPLTAAQRRSLQSATPTQRTALLARYASQGFIPVRATANNTTRGQVPRRGRGNGRNFNSDPGRAIYNAQLASGSSFSIGNSPVTSITKTGIVATIVRPGKDTEATFVAAISPARMPGLQHISSCYSRFRIKHLRYRFASSVPATEQGQVFTACMYSVAVRIPKTLLQVQQLEDFTIGPVWTTGTWRTLKTSIISDRWFDTHAQFNTDDASPGYIVYGFTGIPSGSDILQFGHIESTMTVEFDGLTYYSDEAKRESLTEEQLLLEIQDLSSRLKRTTIKVEHPDSQEESFNSSSEVFSALKTNISQPSID